MPRVHFISDPSCKYTEIGHVLDVKVICHHKVHGIDIQIPSTSGDTTKVWVVLGGVAIQRIRKHECMQDQVKEHFQGERSETRIPIHQKVWD